MGREQHGRLSVCVKRLAHENVRVPCWESSVLSRAELILLELRKLLDEILLPGVDIRNRLA